MSDTGRKVMVETQKLRKYYAVKASAFRTDYVQAVQDVSLHIYEGETLGLVGESGCGKTTYGRTLLQLYQPTSGRILYDGQVIFDSENKVRVNMKPYRRKMQLIFQDPSASLDPRMTVGEIVGEALDIHNLYQGKETRSDRIRELLTLVGLNTEHANRFPHEFSGGQQQRIGIARALAFIAHDLSVVRHISNRIGVMYLGCLVELAESFELCAHPIHPYAKTLLSAVPLTDPEKNRHRQRILLEGDIPSPLNPPSGCRFHTRCPYATDRCSQEMPELKECSPGHFAACHQIQA